MKAKRLLCLVLPIITLILEILPYGAVCNFSKPDGGVWRKTYSYFSLTPFGYANFAPLITAIITCIVLVLLVIYCVTGKQRMAVIARNILCVCAVLSLGPLLFGFHYFSVVGAMITVTLLPSCCFFSLELESRIQAMLHNILWGDVVL